MRSRTVEPTPIIDNELDVEVGKFPKVIVYAEGGVVTGCTSNDPRLQVAVVDLDDTDGKEESEEVMEGFEDCIHNVY